MILARYRGASRMLVYFDPMNKRAAALTFSLATLIAAPAYSMPLFSGNAQELRLSSGDAREMPPGVVSDFQGNVRSAHAVKIDIRALATNELTRSKAGEEIEIVLPTGASYTVSRDRFTPVDGFLFDESQGGLILDPDAEDDKISYHWYGATDDVELSLYVHFGVTSGTLRAGSTSWNLMSHNGILVLREVALRTRPIDGVVFPDVKKSGVPTAKAREPVQVATPKAHDTISVLVVYTPAVLLNYFDPSELAPQTQLMIANLNTALQNSGMITVSVSNAF